jgi:hypothetical protein
MPTGNKYVPTNQRPVEEIDPVLAEIQKLPANHQSLIRTSDKPAEVFVKLFGVSEKAVRRIRGE